MLASPSASRTYSTKSVEFARRVSPVRWSRTFRPDEPGTKWTRSPPRSACGSPARSYRTNELGADGDRPLDDLPREEHPLAGAIERQAVVEEPPAHLRTADLHADLGQHALGLVDDRGDELVAQDVQAGTHPRSLVPTAARSSGMGFPMPPALRLMRPGVPSGGMRSHRPRVNRASRARASAGRGSPGPGRAPSAPWRSAPPGRRGRGRRGAGSRGRRVACPR